uniref:Uncharacterized protein n=1 Tax=Leersia perrieri TaxID=77586 RepID=A0A0D9VXX5_9ORYZ
MARRARRRPSGGARTFRRGRRWWTRSRRGAPRRAGAEAPRSRRGARARGAPAGGGICCAAWRRTTRGGPATRCAGRGRGTGEGGRRRATGRSRRASRWPARAWMLSVLARASMCRARRIW